MRDIMASSDSGMSCGLPSFCTIFVAVVVSVVVVVVDVGVVANISNQRSDLILERKGNSTGEWDVADVTAQSGLGLRRDPLFVLFLSFR
mmetsp:Transcript_24465/g.54080  ORF Transcript_24465/g.54080 Transcript_24465/m.54080 type:complete len:89 (+) Transcript_24465:153-419(+)